MVNRTETGRLNETNADIIPQQDRTLMYATTEQVARRNYTISMLVAQVSELTRDQQSANDTANELAGKISNMMSSIDQSKQQLGAEALRQA